MSEEPIKESPTSAAAPGVTTSKSREQVTEEALEAWEAAGCRGAVLVGTGVGKTKLSIQAVHHVVQKNLQKRNKALSLPRILWLCSSEQLRDVEAEAEFVKWNYAELLPFVTFECYQSFYKKSGTSWDLVVADEGDACLSEEYSKGLLNNQFENLLLVTATVKEEKKELLASICPIVYEYSTQQAQADGLLNQTRFILLEVDLSTEKSIEVKYKAGGVEKSFKTSEAAQYEYLEQQFGILCGEQEKAKQELWSAQLKRQNTQPAKNTLKKVEAKIQRIISQRTTALWTSPTLIAAGKQLACQVLTQENSKVVLFSKRKETAEALGSNVYHSGNKKDNQAIELFNSGQKRGLSVVDAVNRGVNLVGATHFIYVGYHSSGVDFQQRHGRGVRLPLDQIGYHIILLPYYTNKQGQRRPTQAVKWADSMTSEFLPNAVTERTTLTNYLTT